MPSGTPPEEPEETPRRTDGTANDAAGSGPGLPGGGADSTGEIPVHPDDRLWRHPSELARMRAAERTAEPAPTPGSARHGSSATWISRIPTSVVIAAGVAAVLTSVGGLVALAYGGATEADNRVSATVGDHRSDGSHTSIVAGSRRAPGVIVDPDGVVVVVIDNPPELATLMADGRRASVTLRSTDPKLGLAAYQVDPPEGADATDQAAAERSRRPDQWALPDGSPDLGHFDLEWVPSELGPMLMADLGGRNSTPGTQLREQGQLVAMTTRTSDGHTMAVPWPVLRSLGNQLRRQPLSPGGLPANLADDGDGPTVAKAWGNDQLQASDRVVQIDGHPVSSIDETEAVAALHPPGETAVVGCERSGKAVTVEVTLE